MPATSIVEGDRPVVLVNVFTVNPDRQAELVGVLTSPTEAVMRHLDGFVSANLHTSIGGTRVVNYGQWRDAAAYEAVFSNAEATAHMKQAAAIAESFDAHLYTVSSVHQHI